MPRGGYRQHSGRPKGTGTYGEPTKPVRIPVSILDKALDFVKEKGYVLPLYGAKVQAGIPTAADDHVEAKLDLNAHLVKNPSSTFLVRVTGESMLGAGIYPDDILVVDHSLEPLHGKVVVAAIEGELTVKRLSKSKDKVLLLPENNQFQPIDITDKSDVVIWGTVVSVIHYV